MEDSKKGYIHVYTGNGKGKTTASLGVMLRSIGNGYNVAMAQFIKSRLFDYSEMKAINAINSLGAPLGKIVIDQFGSGCCIHNGPSEPDFEGARKGWEKAKEWIASGEWDVIILDEILVALHLGLLPLQEVVDLLKNKPEHVFLILTGRHAPDEIIQLADVVTEMKEIKHYFREGILSQRGIDC